MATFMEMSLEDIIKRKKQNNSRTTNSKPKPLNKVFDARNKIISMKRNQIQDAREILADLAKQKDARLKLQQLRAKRQLSQAIPSGSKLKNHGKYIHPLQKEGRVFSDPSRQVRSQIPSRPKFFNNLNQNNVNKKFLDNRSNAARTRLPIKPIVRTVANDLQIIDDPMGDEYSPPKIDLSNRCASLQLRITAQNDDLHSRPTYHRTALVAKEKSPPRPQSILKKRPMAALRSDQKIEKVEKPAPEYRIIVSNLRGSVTGGDIEELFGDVGGMVESRLVRPGTAEVIYKTKNDAQRALESYHNRQLDGQPMNCLLVTPPSTTAVSKNSNKPALIGTSSNVEPDISTFHKVLFSNF